MIIIIFRDRFVISVVRCTSYILLSNELSVIIRKNSALLILNILKNDSELINFKTVLTNVYSKNV